MPVTLRTNQIAPAPSPVQLVGKSEAWAMARTIVPPSSARYVWIILILILTYNLQA